MDKKIGIIKNEKGMMTDLFHMTQIDVYQLESQWTIIQTEYNLKIDTTSTISIREIVNRIADCLGTCRILVGTAIIGMPYHILDRRGFILCEAQDITTELLNQIYADYCIKKEPKKEDVAEFASMYPQPVDNSGNFFFDFIKAQKQYPQWSSKKMLLPFLSHELFQSLTIICSHIMPWIENYIEERGLELSAKKELGKITIVITHKQCNANR